MMPRIVSALCLALLASLSSAFVVTTATTRSWVSTKHSSSALAVFGGGNKNKKEEEDLSYIETRDMTRAEMEALNKQNEDIMNAELIGMTLFSLVISVPMLYLVWVGFFSETSEMNL